LFSEIKNLSTQVKHGPSVGKVAIGGLFNLVNHEGKHAPDRDFMKKWTPIYFGSTHYTDIYLDEI
jgi:protein SCO1/2